MKKTYSVLAAVFLMLLNGWAMADSYNALEDVGINDRPFILKVTAGGSYTPIAANNYNINLGQGSVVFTGSGLNKIVPIVGVGVGTEFVVEAGNVPFLWQPSFDMEYRFPRTMQGQISQGIAPTDDYNFSYRMQTTTLFFANKFLFPIRERFLPFVSVALGMAMNGAYNYSTTLLSQPPADVPISFGDKHKNVFAYKIGAGLDVNVTDALRLGLAYQFADLGPMSLGSGQAAGQPYPGRIPGQAHTYTQELVFQLTFLFKPY
jgi:opacity protein-like surface antigen